MPPSNRTSGISILEILLVLAIVAVLGGIVAAGWRGLAQREEARSALVSLQQAMWQGSTAASARGETLTLRWEDDELRVVDATGDVVRSWAFPDATTTSLSPGEILAFTPPGRIDDPTVLPDPFTMEVNGRTASLEVSLIGGTRVRW